MDGKGIGNSGGNIVRKTKIKGFKESPGNPVICYRAIREMACVITLALDHEQQRVLELG